MFHLNFIKKKQIILDITISDDPKKDHKKDIIKCGGSTTTKYSEKSNLVYLRKNGSVSAAKLDFLNQMMNIV